MTTTRDEAIARLLREDSPYVLADPVEGELHRWFRHGDGNLRDLYGRARRLFGERTFVVYEDERLTYAETHRRAASLSAALAARGIGKGDRVAIAMRNYPEYVVAFMAVTAMGAVAVTLNSWWQGDELVYGLRDSGARFAILDGERLTRIADRLDVLELGCAVTRCSGALPVGAVALDALIDAHPADALPDTPLAPHDRLAILYTSGSTSEPKGVTITHRGALAAIWSWEFGVMVTTLSSPDERIREPVARWLDGGAAAFDAPLSLRVPQAAMLVNVPFFHVTGLHVMLLMSFRTGRKIVLMYRWNPERALELIERERITDVHGVPTMTWELMNSPDFARRDTSSLISVGGGGAARPPDQVKRMRKQFPKQIPSVGYGMTETNALCSAISGPDYVTRPNSVGRPFAPLTRVEIRDGDGRVLGPGAQGEIHIFTPAAMEGYWNRPEATAETLVDGWIRTGDLGHLDAEGFLFITDRAKDIVIRGGENIGCAEVEAVLLEHPAVFECAAHGVPDERLGEVLCAAVYLRPGERIDPDTLRAHVAGRLAAYKVPTHILLFDAPLPRIASGKIDKRTLKARALERLG